MTSSDRSTVPYRELAAAIPGCAAVQVGETMEYVAEAVAAGCDATAGKLAGASWRALVASAAVETIEDGLATARADGEWRGEVVIASTAGDEYAVDVTLQATDGDAVVWLLNERRGGQQDRQPADSDGDPADDPAVGRGTESSDSSTTNRSTGSSDGPTTDSSSGPTPNPTDGQPSNSAAGAAPVGQTFARTLLDVVDDGVYVLDAEFRILYVNDRFCELFDKSHETLLGSDARALFEDASELDAADGIRETLLERGDQRGTFDATFESDEGERVLEARYRLHPEPDGEYRGSVGVLRDVSEREARAEELRRQRSLIEGILNTIPDVVFAFDEAGDPLVEAAMLDEFAGYSGDELAALGPLGVVPAADRQAVMEQIQSVLVGGETVAHETDIVAKDGTRIPHEFRAAPLELDGEVLGVVGSARDVSERLERETAIARQRDELATLDRINRLLLETTREVVQSGSREAVERVACERLAESPLYEFAWVGKQEFDGDRILPSVTAGEDHGYLDEVTITVDEDEASMEPAARAMSTGVVQIVDVGDDAADSWRATARDHGFESLAAVPLVHADTVYGVLVVYATREDAFSPREQDGFDVLGRSVGAVIHAARSRDLLFADAVVELEFRATGGESLFQRAARELDCTVALDGYVAAGDAWILYLAVEGCAPIEVVDTAAADDRVERARVVSETDAGGRVELVVTESLLHAVSAAGASLQSATATAGAVELVVETPAGADIRELVGHVQDEYDAIELVATRERDREITTVGRPGGLVSELTDRQRESLEAAYRAGYFAWPRESTAEEVAASLGLAAPTLHGHLRKAEHQLLVKLFDAGELGERS